MRLCVFIVVFFAAVGLAVMTNAQGHIANIQQYTIEDGLASNAISGVVQDEGGFIWVATRHGLNRFDGQQFKLYSKRSHHFPNNNIGSIAIDGKNNLWLTFLKPGDSFTPTDEPVVFNTLTEKYEPFLDVFKDEWDNDWQLPTRFIPGKNGDIIIFTTTKAVVRYQPDKRFEQIHIPKVPPHPFLDITILDEGKYWVMPNHVERIYYQENQPELRIGKLSDEWLALGLDKEKNVLIVPHEPDIVEANDQIHHFEVDGAGKPINSYIHDVVGAGNWRSGVQSLMWDFNEQLVWSVTTEHGVTAYRPDQGLLDKSRACGDRNRIWIDRNQI